MRISRRRITRLPGGGERRTHSEVDELRDRFVDRPFEEVAAFERLSPEAQFDWAVENVLAWGQPNVKELRQLFDIYQKLLGVEGKAEGPDPMETPWGAVGKARGALGKLLMPGGRPSLRACGVIVDTLAEIRDRIVASADYDEKVKMKAAQALAEALEYYGF